MATTTNFGWETPDDTDLVKDGALAIRTLGSAIDTSLVDLKGGTTGQVLSKTSNTDMDFTWVTSDDANAIQNAIVDAKGDLIAASAADTPARLAVGNNGETLVADSSASVGLRYQSNFSAGKNKIINGDFAINQRGFTSTTTVGYGFDRFVNQISGSTGTATFSAQTFTPGTAPVAGYESSNYLRIVTTGQTATSTITRVEQPIEDVRTFAGQTATVSFWAKAASGTPSVSVELAQTFGSGGSPSTAVNIVGGNITLSTSWARYSVTVAVPSISGKTIGTTANTSALIVRLWVSAGSDFNARTGSLGIQSNTFEFWGIQAESGNVATAFQTATGTLAGELAACQRYYWRWNGTNEYNTFAQGYGASSATSTVIRLQNPVTMRVKPTSIDYSGTFFHIAYPGASGITVTSFTLNSQTDANQTTVSGAAASGLSTSQRYDLITNNAAAYIGASAEL